MKIKIIFDAQFVGYMEKDLEVDDDFSYEEIKLLFPKYFGVEFDDNCYYVVYREED